MTYVDDKAIANSDPLWRRIPPTHWIYDDGLQRARPSSDAFRDDDDGDPMSVYWEKHPEPPTEAAVLAGHEAYKIAALMAGSARELGLGVFPDATLDDLPSHCKVFGEKRRGRVDKKLAKSCYWIVSPTDDEIQHKKDATT